MKLLKSTILVLLLSLTACDRFNNDDDDDDNETASVETPSTVEGADRYRDALSNLITGRYSGECLDQPDRDAIEGEVVIADNGDISAPDVTGDLINDDVSFVFEREFNETGVKSISYSAADMSSNSTLYLTLEAGNEADDNTVSVRTGLGESSGITCKNSAETPALKNKSLAAALAPYLRRSQTSLRCVGENSARTLKIEITDSEARIDNQVYSFTTGLKSETASVLVPHGALVYLVEYNDSRAVGINLNDEGELDLLNFKEADGDEYTCAP